MFLSFHSYKGGTGKTTFVGNLGVMLAQQGKKVCIIDTDVNGPGLHSLFDIRYDKTLIDFLQGLCSADEVVYKYEDTDVYIVPSKACEEDISAMFSTPGEAREKLLDLIKKTGDRMGIDHFLFDCSPGINRSSLLTMNIVDKAIIVSTIDIQDIRGTYVLSSMASKLGTHAALLFNRIPLDKKDDINEIVGDFSDKLGTELLGLISYDESVARTWSRKIPMKDDPDCGYCSQMRSIAEKLIR
ncbi:MinD/ParA family ATP-binding protein [Methanolobus profundi]|uniref:MinD-like ATPase involved in chromosome partitioning or flagellar assembly n=1 Tax=Methanolobus profundi TaxID=487685 RepID=A0A1I4Q249_9EURY|nr:MinD/ParA family protein [Methanolobus profundi]SFM33715.1 MinD-like ATPase involved in chromosome partitioning or flagellar assembly [Methanolobus profundi]